MQKNLQTLVALIVIFVPILSAQNNILPETKKNQYPTLLNKDYIQVQQQNLRSDEDWWQPDTVIHYTWLQYNYDLRKVYKYNDKGYVESILYQIYVNNEWINDYIYMYEYDLRCNVIAEIYQEYDDGWKDGYKDMFTYDSRNNLLTELSTYWSTYANIWRKDYIFTYKYDDNDNMLSELYQEWRNEDELVNEHQYLYTYADNNMITKVKQDWKNEAWRNRERDTCVYDENNNLILRINQYDNNANVWLNNNYEGFEYEGSNVISYLWKYWWNGNWIVVYRLTYEYDSYNNLISEIQEKYYSGSWVYSSRELSTYDELTNNLTLCTRQEWINGYWIDESRQIFDYDGINLTEHTNQKYDSEWVNVTKFTFAYDKNNNCCLGEVFSWIEGEWTIDYETFEVWYNNSQSVYKVYGSNYKVELSYTKTPKPAGIEGVEQSTPEITIYPNPSKDYINISIENDEIENVQIYNLTGKLVKQEKSNKININDLPAGMYIIKVETEAGNYIKKVIKD